jgi:hypothetical protein
LNDDTWFLLRSLLIDEFKFNYEQSITIVDGIKIVLQNHIIFHEGKFYQQCSGTAMGVSVAVCFAQLYMYGFEKTNNLHQGSLLYRRFIDDVFAVVPTAAIKKFIARHQTNNQHISYTYEQSETEVNFLDLTLYIDNNFHLHGKIDSKLYVKALNKFLHLPYSSMHSAAVKRGFIFGEVLRICRVSSDPAQFDKDRTTYINQLTARGYPRAFVLDSCKSIQHRNRREYLKPKQQETDKKRGAIIVLPFSFSQQHLHKYLQQELKDIFNKHMEYYPNVLNNVTAPSIVNRNHPTLRTFIAKQRAKNHQQ